MYNFFINNCDVMDNGYKIQGNDYNHVKNVLRMKVGETLLVSLDGKSHLCKIEEFTDQAVILSTIQENYADTNLPINICLLQGLPKNVTISSKEMLEAMMEPISTILDNICTVIERTPPSLWEIFLKTEFILRAAEVCLWVLISLSRT